MAYSLSVRPYHTRVTSLESVCSSVLYYDKWIHVLIYYHSLNHLVQYSECRLFNKTGLFQTLHVLHRTSLVPEILLGFTERLCFTWSTTRPHKPRKKTALTKTNEMLDAVQPL